jgi:hypothetical protein
MSERRGAAVVLAAAVLAIATGCSQFSLQRGTPIDTSGIALENGETHFGAVLDQLGPPERMTSLPGGFALLYEYISTNEDQIGLSIPDTNVRAIDWLGFFKIVRGTASAKRETAVFTFDDAGLLRGYRREAWRERLGNGWGVQPLFAVLEVVDASRLEVPPTQHVWGRRALDPLPESLNQGSDPDTGAGGLEQTGTAARVGQRTLAE